MSFFSDTFSSSPQFDHTLTGDLGSFDTSVFASSPNSLYMYDLEKTDMQSSYGNSSVGNVGKSFFSDDFELKEKYETSRDISVLDDPQGSEVSSVMTNPIMEDGQTWDDVKILSSNINHSSDDVFKGLDNPADVTGPTLAELNSQPFEKSYMTSVSMTMPKTPTTHTVTSSGDSVNTWSQDTILKPSNQQALSSSMQSDWSFATEQSGFSNLQQMKQTVVNKPISQTAMNPQSISCRPHIKTEIPQCTSPESDRTIKTYLSAKKVSTPTPQKAVMSSTGSQLQAGKRRSPPSTVGFDPALNQKWEEIRHIVFDDETPSKPKIKRESIGKELIH